GHWNLNPYVSRIWADDGEPHPGPLSTCYQDTSWEAPTFWIPMLPNGACGGRPGYPSGGKPADYPIDMNTGISRYMASMQVMPTVQQCDPTRLQAMSAGGMLVVMMDGSVRTVSPSVSATTLALAIVPTDGFPLGSD